MMVFIPFACMSLMTLLVLVSGYATKEKIGTYSQANYEHDIEKLRIYLKVIEPFLPNLFVNKKSFRIETYHLSS